MKLTTKEAEMIALSLGYWANWMETGSIIMSARDAEAARKPFKALDMHQMEKVVELRKLAQRVLEATSMETVAAEMRLEGNLPPAFREALQQTREASGDALEDAYWKSVDR